MAGGDEILGTARAKLKIFDIEKTMRVFVVKKQSFKYDLLIGLDTIYEFALEQNCRGQISQAKNEKNTKKKSFKRKWSRKYKQKFR